MMKAVGIVLDNVQVVREQDETSTDDHVEVRRAGQHHHATRSTAASLFEDAKSVLEEIDKVEAWRKCHQRRMAR